MGASRFNAKNKDKICKLDNKNTCKAIRIKDISEKVFFPPEEEQID